MEISILKIFFITNLMLQLTADGKTILNVTQQELMTVEVGQSVNITCSFFYDSPSYTVKWTRGCNHSVSLTDQTCYNGRIHDSDADPTYITTDSGTPCCERHHTMTIVNVTENDSGIYCCHIHTVRGQRGHGTGTRLEVTPRTTIADPDTHTRTSGLWLLMEILRLVFLTVLIILLCVAIKHH